MPSVIFRTSILEKQEGRLSPLIQVSPSPAIYPELKLRNIHVGKLFAIVKDLPQRVCIALAHVVEHLQSFGLAEALTRTEFFSKFTERRHMLLNSNTLANL